MVQGRDHMYLNDIGSRVNDKYLLLSWSEKITTTWSLWKSQTLKTHDLLGKTQTRNFLGLIVLSSLLIPSENVSPSSSLTHWHFYIFLSWTEFFTVGNSRNGYSFEGELGKFKDIPELHLRHFPVHWRRKEPLLSLQSSESDQNQQILILHPENRLLPTIIHPPKGRRKIERRVCLGTIPCCWRHSKRIAGYSFLSLRLSCSEDQNLMTKDS